MPMDSFIGRRRLVQPLPCSSYSDHASPSAIGNDDTLLGIEEVSVDESLVYVEHHSVLLDDDAKAPKRKREQAGILHDRRSKRQPSPLLKKEPPRMPSAKAVGQVAAASLVVGAARVKSEEYGEPERRPKPSSLDGTVRVKTEREEDPGTVQVKSELHDEYSVRVKAEEGEPESARGGRMNFRDGSEDESGAAPRIKSEGTEPEAVELASCDYDEQRMSERNEFSSPGVAATTAGVQVVKCEDKESAFNSEEQREPSNSAVFLVVDGVPIKCIEEEPTPLAGDAPIESEKTKEPVITSLDDDHVLRPLGDSDPRLTADLAHGSSSLLSGSNDTTVDHPEETGSDVAENRQRGKQKRAKLYGTDNTRSMAPKQTQAKAMEMHDMAFKEEEGNVSGGGAHSFQRSPSNSESIAPEVDETNGSRLLLASNRRNSEALLRETATNEGNVVASEVYVRQGDGASTSASQKKQAPPVSLVTSTESAVRKYSRTLGTKGPKRVAGARAKWSIEEKREFLRELQSKAIPAKHWRTPLERPWEESFQDLVAWHAKFGTFSVPRTLGGRFQLGRWVDKQRHYYELVQKGEKGNISVSRIKKLDKIGFSWKVAAKPPSQAKAWDMRFEELRVFKENFGHCNVPLNWEPNSALSHWVVNMRRKHKRMKERDADLLTEAQVRALNNIGFTWRPLPKKYTWKDRLQHLKVFRSKYKHCNVTPDYFLDDELYIWVRLQRWLQARVKLNIEHKKELDTIGFEF